MADVKSPVPDNELEQALLKYKPIIGFRVKKALGGHSPDWEDVVQEIITQVVEKVRSGDFRGDSSLGTFLYTITTRRIIDYIRQKTRPLREAPEPSSSTDPAEDAERREQAQMLGEALEKLKPKYREVLYLYFYKEMTREETALRLGITPRKVSERVNYAQKLLKKLIKP